MKKRIITGLIALGLVVNMGLNANAKVVNQDISKKTVVEEIAKVEIVKPLYSSGTTIGDGGGTSCAHYFISGYEQSPRGGGFIYVTRCEFCGVRK
jgi:hypothetical protein